MKQQLSTSAATASAPSSLWDRLKAFVARAPQPSGGEPPLVFPVAKGTPVYAAHDVGGKAHNCIRLNSVPGVVIPPCAVISCAEFDDALQRNGLSALSDVARRLLQEWLKPGKRYAVRSSADVEDSGDSAMAGMVRVSYMSLRIRAWLTRAQFLTVLNVAGDIVAIEAAVVQCWQSTRTVQDSKPRMGVVVMEQIDSDKAGVLFQGNPITKSTHAWVINAAWGQGEGVVGGTLAVDTYTLAADDEHALRKSHVVSKTEMITLSDSGTQRVAVPADKRDVACLTESEIAQVARAGKAILAHTQCPQDIEFAFARGVLYVLQTRPITTMRALLRWEAPEPGLFQLNGHMATPLSRFFQPCFVGGHPPGVMALSAHIGAGFSEVNACIINGFAYFCHRNPGPFRAAPKALPPPFVLRMILRLTSQKAIKQARVFWGEKRFRAFASETWPKRKQELIALHAGWQAKNFAAMSDANLARELADAQEYGRAMVAEHAEVTMFNLSPVAWFVIRAMHMTGCAAVEGFACVDGYSAPSLGLQGEFPAEFAAIAADETLCAELEHGSKAEPQAALDRMAAAAASPGADAFRRVLGIVQYRLADGYDCANDTLRQEPALLLAAFATAVRKVKEGKADEARARGEAQSQALRARVPTDAERREFDELLDDARFVASIRDERALYMDLTAMGIIHHMLLEAGARLAARQQGAAGADGTLALEASLEELQAALTSGAPPAAAWWDEMRARRATRQTLSVLEAPEAIGGPVLLPTREYFPDECQARSALSCIFAIEEIFKAPDFESTGQVQDDPDVIVGLAGSSGVARGKVRIVNTAREAAAVRAGEIVVSKYSSSVINLVLATAGGIVTDLGGVLCHAAICAREAQLPCVVATHSATQRLKTGDEVEINGSLGVVRIVARA